MAFATIARELKRLQADLKARTGVDPDGHRPLTGEELVARLHALYEQVSQRHSVIDEVLAQPDAEKLTDGEVAERCGDDWTAERVYRYRHPSLPRPPTPEEEEFQERLRYIAGQLDHQGAEEPPPEASPAPVTPPPPVPAPKQAAPVPPPPPRPVEIPPPVPVHFPRSSPARHDDVFGVPEHLWKPLGRW